MMTLETILGHQHRFYRGSIKIDSMAADASSAEEQWNLEPIFTVYFSTKSFTVVIAAAVQSIKTSLWSV